MVHPLGIDNPQPRLSWALSHTERGQVQSAHQLLVSSSPEADTGNQWDTGKVASEQSTYVRYAGPALKSRTSYFWKVRYWDRNGSPGPYCAVARFETAFLPGTSMGGEWIGGANQLRKEVTLPSITVREGDRVVWQNGAYQSGCPGLSAGRDTRGAVILQAGSGRYVFELSASGSDRRSLF
jgi:hypothetical protein